MPWAPAKAPSSESAPRRNLRVVGDTAYAIDGSALNEHASVRQCGQVG